MNNSAETLLLFVALPRAAGCKFLLFLAALVSGPFLLPALSPAVSAAERMNIVILYADDLRHDSLGVAGNPVVKTPHLDRLARAGVRFDHNYVTTSICGVSRASLLTGQWMARHGCRGFTEFKTPWGKTFPGILRENGYHVGHVGKWHNGKFPADKYDFGRAYHGRHWYQVEGQRIHVTERNRRDALAFLDELPPEKPFCLTVAFFAPHAQDNHPRQYLPQPWSASAYEGVAIPMPPNASLASWERMPPFFDEKNEGRARWRKRFDTPAKYQTTMTNYYRLVTEVDAACGAVLDKIDALGLRSETLVLFTSDNGYFHGEHGLADKWYPHQESTRTPLIIDDPRLAETQRGVVRDQLTLNVDLAPTILSAAGFAPPSSMQGEDLSVLYDADNRPPWRTDFFYEHPTIRDASFIPPSEALIGREWSYMFWPKHDYEQLFHLPSDPIEEADLARDADYAEQRAALRDRFSELRASAGR